MFEAGIVGTLEDLAMAAEGVVVKGGNAISNVGKKAKVLEGANESAASAERWFESIHMRVLKKRDGTFNPSLDEFLAKHFDGNADDIEHLSAKKMMETEKGFIKMVNRISECYEVPAEIVRNKIDKLVEDNKTTKLQEDIEAGLDPMKYITSGSELVKILMQMESGDITEEAGIELIKKLDEKELTINVGAFISDIETRVKELSGVKAKEANSSKAGKNVEAESIPEKKKSVSLKEAIQETVLGQRLFTRMEEAVAKA